MYVVRLNHEAEVTTGKEPLNPLGVLYPLEVGRHKRSHGDCRDLSHARRIIDS